MTDPSGLLAGILDAPDDDAPRLVYADWLDEHGQPERAAFIRCQVELARLTEHEPPKHRHNCKPPRGSVLCIRCEWLLEHGDKAEALRRRERELWDGIKTAPEFFGLPLNQLLLPGEAVPSDRRSLGIVSRGFVAEARTTLAAWRGGPCRRCNGNGYLHRCTTCGCLWVTNDPDDVFPGGSWSLADGETAGRCCDNTEMHAEVTACKACDNTGHDPGIGPALVAVEPVASVVTEREPYQSLANGAWYWMRGEEGSHYLPDDLFNYFRQSGDEWNVGFPTRTAALAALSAALLAEAKDEARQPLARPDAGNARE